MKYYNVYIESYHIEVYTDDPVKAGKIAIQKLAVGNRVFASMLTEWHVYVKYEDWGQWYYIRGEDK